MALPLLGGANGLNDGGGGVYSAHPATQVKYYTDWQKGPQTQARIYITHPGRTSSEILDKVGPARPYAEKATKYGYIDFILQHASEQYAEKAQIVELLSDDYAAYFFGQRASVFRYSGTLLSTQQDDWWVGFTYLYREVLRGTKLASLGALVHLRYDTRLVTGALLDFSTDVAAETQMSVSFSFSMLVRRVDIIPSQKMSSMEARPSDIEGPTMESFKLDEFNTALNALSAYNRGVVSYVAVRSSATPTPVTVEERQAVASSTPTVDELLGIGSGDPGAPARPDTWAERAAAASPATTVWKVAR